MAFKQIGNLELALFVAPYGEVRSPHMAGFNESPGEVGRWGVWGKGLWWGCLDLGYTSFWPMSPGGQLGAPPVKEL